MKLIQIEHGRSVRGFVGHAVVIPTNAGGQRESGGRFPLVLEIGHQEVATQTMTAPRSYKGNLGQVGVDHVRLAREVEIIVGGLALIETDAPILHACFESVLAASPAKIVNESVRCPNFDVGGIVVQSNEIAGAHRKWQRAGLRVVIGRAVDIELQFVENIRRKGVFQSEQVIGRMIDNLQFVLR